MCVRGGRLPSPLLRAGTTNAMRTDSEMSVLCSGRLFGFPEKQYSWDGAMRTTLVGFRSDLWAHLLPTAVPLARQAGPLRAAFLGLWLIPAALCGCS